MAYISPTTRSTGFLVSAAIWNADVVANPIALYAGAMSVAAQAAFDMLYASSATQLARIPNGVTGQVFTATTSAAPAWSSNLRLLGALRAEGAPSGSGAGVGVEIGIDSTNGLVRAYNRTSSAFIPQLFDALSFDFRPSGASRMVLTTSGLSVTGTLAVSSTVTTGGLSITGTLAVSSTVTGGTYNGQTISSAASFTGSLGVGTTFAVTGASTFSGTIRSASGGRFEGAAPVGSGPGLNLLVASGNGIVQAWNDTTTAYIPLHLSGQSLTFLSDGAAVMALSATALSPLVPVRGLDGTAAAPTFAFSSSTGSGMFFGSSTLQFAVAGTLRMQVSATTIAAGADNVQSLGNTSVRYTAVWAVDGTIETSDERDKHILNDLDDALGVIRMLRTVRYRWKTDDATAPWHMGLLAQDVRRHYGDTWGGVRDGDRLGLHYSEMIPPLVRSVQQLDERVARLERVAG